MMRGPRPNVPPSENTGRGGKVAAGAFHVSRADLQSLTGQDLAHHRRDTCTPRTTPPYLSEPCPFRYSTSMYQRSNGGGGGLYHPALQQYFTSSPELIQQQQQQQNIITSVAGNHMWSTGKWWCPLLPQALGSPTLCYHHRYYWRVEYTHLCKTWTPGFIDYNFFINLFFFSSPNSRFGRRRQRVPADFGRFQQTATVQPQPQRRRRFTRFRAAFQRTYFRRVHRSGERRRWVVPIVVRVPSDRYVRSAAVPSDFRGGQQRGGRSVVASMGRRGRRCFVARLPEHRRHHKLRAHGQQPDGHRPRPVHGHVFRGRFSISLWVYKYYTSI